MSELEYIINKEVLPKESNLKKTRKKWQFSFEKLFQSLYFYVLLAIVLGAFLGVYNPDLAVKMKPLGDSFIKLIKMIIAPVIFTTVVTGIGSMENMKKLGRVGFKSLLYFEVVTTLSLAIGLIVVKIIEPGKGLNIKPSDMDAKSVEMYSSNAESHGFIEFFTNIIPQNFFGAFANGEILQVLFISILFGIALAKMGAPAKPLVSVLEKISQVFFTIVNFIMKLAPIGAFGAIAFTIGKHGIESLLSLGLLMVSVYTTCLLFIVIVLGGILKLAGFNLFKYLAFIKEEILLVLGTSSSEAAMPRMMKKLEDLGCKKVITSLVIPSGYSFNLDGTSIYLTMAAVFLAQATNTQLSFHDEIVLLLILMLTSKGAAAVTGGGFITLAATLASVGTIPVGSIAILLGVDRFMSEARAITNLIGNGVATIVIAKWEKELDYEKAEKVA